MHAAGAMHNLTPGWTPWDCSPSSPLKLECTLPLSLPLRMPHDLLFSQQMLLRGHCFCFCFCCCYFLGCVWLQMIACFFSLWGKSYFSLTTATILRKATQSDPKRQTQMSRAVESSFVSNGNASTLP